METVQLGEGVSIEVGAELRVQVESIDLVFTSRFLGTFDTDDVLISLDPRMEHFESRLEPGTVFLASYLAEDVRYQFRACFERLITDPIRAVVLNTPDEVINIEQHKVPRTPCSLPVQVDIRKTLAATISDISAEGCRLEMPIGDCASIPLEVGDRVRLRLRAPGSQHGYIVEGQVRKVGSSDLVKEARVRFDNLPGILRNFIESLTRAAY